MELELVQEVMEVQAKYSWDDLKTMLAFLSHVSEVGLESPVIFLKLFQLGRYHGPSSWGKRTQGVYLHEFTDFLKASPTAFCR